MFFPSRDSGNEADPVPVQAPPVAKWEITSVFNLVLYFPNIVVHFSIFLMCFFIFMVYFFHFLVYFFLSLCSSVDLSQSFFPLCSISSLYSHSFFGLFPPIFASCATTPTDFLGFFPFLIIFTPFFAVSSIISVWFSPQLCSGGFPALCPCWRDFTAKISQGSFHISNSRWT